MVDFTLQEAQLYRLLAGFFGRDQVIPRMTVMAACGGKLPVNGHEFPTGTDQWAKTNRCLFTIIDHDDEPRMVVEFFSGLQDSIDLVEEEHQRLLRPILKAAGVTYITLSDDEFADLLNPESDSDIYAFLKAKLESVGLVEA
jgi:hypothetical protein